MHESFEFTESLFWVPTGTDVYRLFSSDWVLSLPMFRFWELRPYLLCESLGRAEQLLNESHRAI